MTARAWMLAALTAVACRQSPPAEYCEARHRAWVAAFPDRSPNHDAFVEACASSMRRANDKTDQCRRACFANNIKGTRDPAAEYAAMTACESTCLK